MSEDQPLSTPLGLDAVWEVADRVAPLLKAERLSRAELQALFEAVLELKDLAEQDRLPALPTRTEAQDEANLKIAPVLLRELFGWLAPGQVDSAFWLRLIHGPVIDLDKLPARRTELKAWLSKTPNMLLQPMRGILYQSLNWLDDGSGYVPPLLTPTPKEGQGANPRRAQTYEAWIWCWITYQVGRDRTVDSAKHEVAKAASVTPNAVEAWRNAWVRRDGAKHVKEQLAEWQERGASGRVNKSQLYRTDLSFLVRKWREAKMPAKTGSRRALKFISSMETRVNNRKKV